MNLSDWKQQSLASKIFLLTVVIETCILVIISGLIFIHGPELLCTQGETAVNCLSPASRIQAICYIVISSFILWFGLSGLVYVNKYELTAFYMSTVLITLFCTYRFFEMSHRQVFDYIIFLTTAISQLIYIALACQIFKEYTWRFFKTVGADIRFQTMYKTEQQFFSLLKFDLLFALLIVIMAFALSNKFLGRDILLDILLFFISIGVFISGHVGVAKEMKFLMAVFFVFCSSLLIIISCKFYRFMKATEEYELKATIEYYVVVGIALIIRILVFVWGLKTFKNFGLGLKNFEYLKKSARRADAEPLLADPLENTEGSSVLH
jgi:hypothetical protein